MRQVFYIEADEEMISVIGRIRKSSASENIIVAPHRSLILQSIVNLRLLNHDARKNGKEIIVVTQDEQSRSLCEKAGIRTQTALDEDRAFMNQSQNQRASSLPPVQQNDYVRQNIDQQSYQEAPEQKHHQSVHLPLSDTLGSSDFFGRADMPVVAPPSQPVTYTLPKQPSMESLSKPSYDSVKQITVRDKNPQKLTMLNSHRFEEETRLNQQKSFTPPSLRGTQPMRPLFVPPQATMERKIQSFPASLPQEQSKPSFFGKKKMEFSMPITRSVSEEPLEKQVVVSDGGNMRAFFIFFGIISILSVVGVYAYLFLPKAIVHVKLKTTTQKSDFEFNGGTSITTYSAESKTIPVKIFETDEEVSRSFDATGTTSLADQKSRGSVTIYNEYNASPQVLVASTRLLSQDGKVFRLLSGVTIPGMTTVGGKMEPGAIEAIVVADQSGREYNISATTFTIPGFEGSEKHSKFYAKSSNAMNGGGVSGSDATAVSDQDITKAKKTMESESKKMAMDIIDKNLAPGEKVLSEATDVSVVSANASPQSGSITSTFEYRVKLHIRTFVFSEEDLKKMLSTLFAQQSTAKGIELSPKMIDVQYGEPTEDFASGTIRISIHAEGRSESNLDQEQLKADLLGQNQSDIAVLLQKYTQIDMISIDLSPEFVISRVPTRPDRVTIEIDSVDTGEKK